MKNPYAQQEQTFLTALKQGTRNLHDLVMQAAKIWYDPEFHAWRNLSTLDAVEEYLSGHLSRVLHNVTVAEVLALAAMFPHANQWGTASLAEMIEQATQKTSPAEPAVTPRRRATLKDLEQAEAERHFAEQQRDKYQQENERLREEIARLRARLEELQRLLTDDLITA